MQFRRLCVRMRPIYVVFCLGALFGFVTLQLFSSKTPSPAIDDFVFIGGYPRSGTTLMRVLMDVHPDVRCGPESRIIPAILGFYSKYIKRELKRLRLIGLYPNVTGHAMSAFLREIIKGNGEPANRLCNKDPLSLRYLSFLSELFPAAKFLLMVRDGRAVVASIIKRKVSIGGFDWRNPDVSLKYWDNYTSNALTSCQLAGPNVCQPVFYEQLVLRPRESMTKILAFLNLPWTDAVLHHADYVDEEAKLVKFEKSSSQVVHPIHIDALSAWAANDSVLPKHFIDTAHTQSPMLQMLGYAALSIPPVYGVPEPEILEQTLKLRQDKEFNQVFSATQH